MSEQFSPVIRSFAVARSVLSAGLFELSAQFVSYAYGAGHYYVRVSNFNIFYMLAAVSHVRR